MTSRIRVPVKTVENRGDTVWLVGVTRKETVHGLFTGRSNSMATLLAWIWTFRTLLHLPIPIFCCRQALLCWALKIGSQNWSMWLSGRGDGETGESRTDTRSPPPVFEFDAGCSTLPDRLPCSPVS